MIETRQISLVYQRIGELLAVAAARFRWKVLPAVEISFDLTGRAAGQMQARNGQVRLRFNVVPMRQDFDRFLKEVVGHEVAHAVVFWQYGARVKPHGPEWRAVMALFGLEPRRCHDYAVEPARRLTRYRYRCGCREHELTAIRHHRVQRGEREYRCRHCGRKLIRVTDDS